LLDAGHPQEALFSLRIAMDAGVSSGHAARIVSIARDLDEGLARRAAHVALNDPTLDPRIRADLEPIASPPAASPLPEPEARAPVAAASPLARRVEAEHHPVETTAFPIEADSDLTPEVDPDALDPQEASLIAQDLDCGALSAESLASFTGEDPADADAAVGDSGDVLSHWHEGGFVDDLGHDLAADLDTDELLSSADLESIGGGLGGRFEAGLAAGVGSDDALLDPRDAETDSDLTPLLDASDEQTSPLVGPAPAEEFVFGGEVDAAPPSVALRSLKALAAVPVAAGEGWIEIDVDERGKSRLPLSRIEAIAMVAVVGVAPRPILLIDFALNWNEDPAEPLKVIRFRSDRFDPVRFEPAAGSPLAALMAWVARLRERTGAVCLPSLEALEGRFTRFESLDRYEREVLGARRPTSEA
jgi:hypothetical protein